MVEATLRGLRNRILQTHRVAFTADEIVNAWSTPWSDCQTIAHFIPKSKLCTYAQGECDDLSKWGCPPQALRFPAAPLWPD